MRHFVKYKRTSNIDKFTKRIRNKGMITEQSYHNTTRCHNTELDLNLIFFFTSVKFGYRDYMTSREVLLK